MVCRDVRTVSAIWTRCMASANVCTGPCRSGNAAGLAVPGSNAGHSLDLWLHGMPSTVRVGTAAVRDKAGVDGRCRVEDRFDPVIRQENVKVTCNL